MSTARFGRDIPSIVLDCLWCGSPLGEDDGDFDTEYCREAWYDEQHFGGVDREEDLDD